jgi:Zn-finger protein
MSREVTSIVGIFGAENAKYSLTINGASVKACEDCILRKGEEVERKVAEKNVN